MSSASFKVKSSQVTALTPPCKLHTSLSNGKYTKVNQNVPPESLDGFSRFSLFMSSIEQRPKKERFLQLKRISVSDLFLGQ